MKASEFYQQGQALQGIVKNMFPNMFEKPETKETPEQPQQAPAGQQPQADRSSPQYNQGTPVRPPQSPNRGPADMGRFDPKYAGESEFNLSREFAYDERIVDQIVQKYVNAGYDPRYAVGMAANAIVESNLVPTALNESEGAFGIAQWRNDRLDGLRDFADRSGKTINDLNTQIEFSMEELRTTQQNHYNRIIKADPETAADYARLIDKHYERSDGKARERRAAIAGQLWRDYYGEGGRAEGPMVSFDEDTVPITQPNAQTRDEYVAQMAQDNPAGGLDMGSLLEAREAAQPEDTPMQNPAVDYMVGQSMERQAPPQTAPTTADFTSEVSRSSQSPAGGQGELGRSQEAAGTGTMREGLMGGLQDIFGRREDESDASFGDRRRNIFLNAAEGFQMLSRGVDADFVTPTQQRLNQAQRRITNTYNDTEQVRQQENFVANLGIQRQQEARLARAQALNEKKMIMDVEATRIERENDTQSMQATADFLDKAGYEEYAKLARSGNVQTAMDLYSSAEEAKIPNNEDIMKYSLDGATIEGAAARANSLRRPELADQIRSSNPRVAYEAVQTLNKMDAEEGLQQNVDWATDDIYQGYLKTMPQSLSPSKKQQYRSLARSARLEEDATTRNTLLERMVELGASPNPDSEVVAGLSKGLVEDYNSFIGPGADLRDAGHRTMGIAADANFNPNQLKGAIITPFARFLRGLGEPGRQLAEEFLNVSDSDAFAQALLESIRNGELGNLAQGVTGQLSNQEGQALLKQIGDGRNERAEIMALGQLLAAGVEKDIAGIQAKKDYLTNVQETGGSFSFETMDDLVTTARRADTVFPLVSGGMDDLALLQEQTVKRWMEETGSPEPENFASLPDKIRGMVVRYVDPDGSGETYLPLFANKFDEYQPDIEKYKNRRDLREQGNN